MIRRVLWSVCLTGLLVGCASGNAEDAPSDAPTGTVTLLVACSLVDVTERLAAEREGTYAVALCAPSVPCGDLAHRLLADAGFGLP